MGYRIMNDVSKEVIQETEICDSLQQLKISNGMRDLYESLFFVCAIFFVLQICDYCKILGILFLFWTQCKIHCENSEH